MHINRLVKLMLLLGLVLLATHAPALAQSFTQTGRAVSSAGTLSGGGFSLAGNTGQPEAGTTPLTGGGFSLKSGSNNPVQSAPGSSSSSVYLPLILRN
ncbi:MAG: hypothetical protein JW953_07920 [Anaerolineae bacterium]|nr:hypothetical protein [Anaerolineae bacterium]